MANDPKRSIIDRQLSAPPRGFGLGRALTWVFYGSGILMGAYLGWLIFGPSVADNPSATAGMWRQLFFASMVYIGIQIALIWMGSSGKNITNDAVTLLDVLLSLPVFLPLIAAILLGWVNAFTPEGEDVPLLIGSVFIGALDIIGLSVMLIRANRRGDEIVGDR